MAPGTGLSARALLCLVAATSVSGQVASLCRPNERFLACGCQKTCKDPVPSCRAVCRVGCYCHEDEYRNATGHCVKLADCPPFSSAYKLDTSEPRTIDADCPENEEYRFCEPCNRTCEHPEPICPAQCNRGCFCKEGYLRESNGTCVPQHLCSNLSGRNGTLNNTSICSSGLSKECENCEKTCRQPKPACQAQCDRECFCPNGLYRAPNGQCVKLEECPNEDNAIPEQICSVEQVFKECENCEKTCSDPNPICPAQCSRGCFCRDGLFKADNGSCLKLEDCPNQSELF